MQEAQDPPIRGTPFSLSVLCLSLCSPAELSQPSQSCYRAKTHSGHQWAKARIGDGAKGKSLFPSNKHFSRARCILFIYTSNIIPRNLCVIESLALWLWMTWGKRQWDFAPPPLTLGLRAEFYFQPLSYFASTRAEICDATSDNGFDQFNSTTASLGQGIRCLPEWTGSRDGTFGVI